MRYLEIINEGRDAPLYHGTSAATAIRVLKDDEIWAATQHTRKSLFDDVENPDEPVFGVSLSRNPKLAMGFGNVMFEIDQRKLSQRSRLVPIDYWAPQYLRQGKPTLRAHNPSPGADKYEFEEFCVGPISPLSRYLISINMSRKTYERIAKDYQPNMTAILLKHPLLKVDGRLINHEPDIIDA